MLLDVLSKYPDVQASVLHELARNPRLKRKLIVVAHEKKKQRVSSGSRKKFRNS